MRCMRALVGAVAVAGTVASAQETIAVPSGQPVTLVETVWGEPGPDGLTLRFHFLAPEISFSGGTVGFEAAAADMQFLCDTYALGRLPSTGPTVQQVVISLSDRPVPFGQSDPEATQFFEAYRVDSGACIWEAF